MTKKQAIELVRIEKELRERIAKLREALKELVLSHQHNETNDMYRLTSDTQGWCSLCQATMLLNEDIARDALKEDDAERRRYNNAQDARLFCVGYITEIPNIGHIVIIQRDFQNSTAKFKYFSSFNELDKWIHERSKIKFPKSHLGPLYLCTKCEKYFETTEQWKVHECQLKEKDK